MSEKVGPLARTAELWAKLYYAFADQIFASLGAERGREVLVECIKNYGRIRGEGVARFVSESGLKRTAENFVRYYDAPFADIQRATLPLFPACKLEPSDGTTFCPYKEIWETYPNGRQLGLIYCEEFHKAMWAGYHPKLRVEQDRIMTRGDAKCTFWTYMEGEENAGVAIFDQK